MSFWLLVVTLLAAETGVPEAAARLSWMTGHWVSTREGMTTEELWTSPEGGALVGMNKAVKAGRMVSFEFLRIEAAKPGGLAYVASPQAAPATSFALVEQGARRVVFANEAHDFPQRILYWLDEKGALHARIEGTTGGHLQHQEWVFTRAR